MNLLRDQRKGLNLKLQDWKSGREGGGPSKNRRDELLPIYDISIVTRPGPEAREAQLYFLLLINGSEGPSPNPLSINRRPPIHMYASISPEFMMIRPTLVSEDYFSLFFIIGGS